MTQKYFNYVPLYRQEKGFKQFGIQLSRQTMANWIIKLSDLWLTTVYDELKRELVSRNGLYADETTFQVLKETGKKPQSKSYIWLYRTSGDTDNPIILYEYQPDRKYKRPVEFLKEFNGYLHTDGYDAYHKLTDEVTVCGCWHMFEENLMKP